MTSPPPSFHLSWFTSRQPVISSNLSVWISHLLSSLQPASSRIESLVLQGHFTPGTLTFADQALYPITFPSLSFADFPSLILTPWEIYWFCALWARREDGLSHNWVVYASFALTTRKIPAPPPATPSAPPLPTSSPSPHPSSQHTHILFNKNKTQRDGSSQLGLDALPSLQDSFSVINFQPRLKPVVPSFLA